MEKLEEYGVLKSNQPFISAKTQNASPQIIIQHVHQHPHTNSIEPAHVPAKVKRQIERDYNKRLREECVKEHTTSLYSLMNHCAKLKIRQHTEYKKHPVKMHRGKISWTESRLPSCSSIAI